MNTHFYMKGWCRLALKEEQNNSEMAYRGIYLPENAITMLDSPKVNGRIDTSHFYLDLGFKEVTHLVRLSSSLDLLRPFCSFSNLLSLSLALSEIHKTLRTKQV